MKQTPAKRAIEQAALLLRHARYAVALTGAGISVPSGIPDFRSPGAGLWESDDVLEVASLDGFLQNPAVFYHWVHPLAQKIVSARANAAHTALAYLEREGRLRAVITQNIDGLHQAAGSARVLELHGNLKEASCLDCHRTFPGHPILEQFAETSQVPRCHRCGGVIKPNIVLYGENLSARIVFETDRELDQCDLLVVAGSSLQVSPAADLPWRVKQRHVPVILINLGETTFDHQADVLIRQDVAEALPQIVQACC